MVNFRDVTCYIPSGATQKDKMSSKDSSSSDSFSQSGRSLRAVGSYISPPPQLYVSSSSSSSQSSISPPGSYIAPSPKLFPSSSASSGSSSPRNSFINSNLLVKRQDLPKSTLNMPINSTTI